MLNAHPDVNDVECPRHAKVLIDICEKLEHTPRVNT